MLFFPVIPVIIMKGAFTMDLKIIYQICYGIDAHKTFVVACIASTNNKCMLLTNTITFLPNARGLRELLQ